MLKITKIQVSKTPVYDLTVPETSCFYANGVVVHNCAEIDLPTKPLKEVNDPDGEIALCTLSAINWGMILDPADFAKPCELAVRGLDALLTYQHYPVPAAKNSTDLYRPLGIGIINFAYWLAKNGYTYTSSACLPAVDEYMEAMSYYLIKTSITLAQEFGPCAGWQNLKYADGVLPVDTRKSDVDDLVPYTERMPWALLRNQVVKTGIRNATLMALMPSECQHWANKLYLSDGRQLDFHQLLESQKIDWKTIEENGIPQRFSFYNPIEIATPEGNKPVYEFYYNGVSELVELEFSDGETYKFTPNHRLLVIRAGKKQWVEVRDLVVDDEIIAH